MPFNLWDVLVSFPFWARMWLQFNPVLIVLTASSDHLGGREAGCLSPPLQSQSFPKVPINLQNLPGHIMSPFTIYFRVTSVPFLLHCHDSNRNETTIHNIPTSTHPSYPPRYSCPGWSWSQERDCPVQEQGRGCPVLPSDILPSAPSLPYPYLWENAKAFNQLCQAQFQVLGTQQWAKRQVPALMELTWWGRQ